MSVSITFTSPLRTTTPSTTSMVIGAPSSVSISVSVSSVSAGTVAMRWWIEHLSTEIGDGFPEKVTAFRKEMAVHGKFGEPCPVCDSPVQRIVHADNETNYCAACQTGGKVLKDRALSALLKDDWPRSLDEL